MFALESQFYSNLALYLSILAQKKAKCLHTKFQISSTALSLPSPTPKSMMTLCIDTTTGCVTLLCTGLYHIL